MSSAFQVGDKCVILPPRSPQERSPPDLEAFTGSTVTLLRFAGGSPLGMPQMKYTDFWEVDIKYLGESLFVDEHRLQKLPPPKQEREPLGSWEDCPWKPPIEVTV